MYRPQTNVVTRPVAGIGQGYSLVGHHEILIPLLGPRSAHRPVLGLPACRAGHAGEGVIINSSCRCSSVG